MSHDLKAKIRKIEQEIYNLETHIFDEMANYTILENSKISIDEPDELIKKKRKMLGMKRRIDVLQNEILALNHRVNLLRDMLRNEESDRMNDNQKCCVII